MILCKDVHALLHVISLVDWPKHVKFFFFLLKQRIKSTLKPQSVGGSTPGSSEFGLWIDVGLSRSRIDIRDMYPPSLLEGYFKSINA